VCAFDVQWRQLDGVREMRDADAHLHCGDVVRLGDVFRGGGVHSDDDAVVREQRDADVRERLHLGRVRRTELLGDGSYTGVWEMRDAGEGVRRQHRAMGGVGTVQRRGSMRGGRGRKLQQRSRYS
jgi:hypothetical protein